jgi:hypothetical protein
MVITHFISRGSISKVGDGQFVFAKKIDRNSTGATQKLQYKIVQ